LIVSFTVPLTASSTSASQAIVIISDAASVPEEAVAATSCKIPSSHPKTLDKGKESSRATSSEGPTDSGYVTGGENVGAAEVAR
jgi:hypothetical protein